MTTRASALVRLLEKPAPQRRIGPFLLVEEIGAGGYAPVWLAREMYGQTELRLAAVKLFSLDALGSAKESIIEEARALSRVEHPHIARFYSLAIDDSIGVMGLAMELLGGRSLERRLSEQHKLPIEEVLPIGIAMASALAAVHRAGLVHRDVKPSNIVEEAPGAYKLIDFGIARASSNESEIGVEENLECVLPRQTEADATRRVTGLATGTPGYIDPACHTGRNPPSAASDLYALGATLYRCVAAVLPACKHQTDDGDAILDPLVLSGEAPPPPLACRIATIPSAFARIVDQLLDPKPENRPKSASQVEYELEQIRYALAGRNQRLPSEDEGPFRGLRRFEATDRGVFFGRKNELTAALALLRQQGLVALAGSSGSGKSSLARAALLPALAEGALVKWPNAWDIAIAEPGRDPMDAIASALEPFVPNARKLAPVEIIHSLVERITSTERGLVLFVDQLEELVTTSTPQSRDAAADLLAQIGERPTAGLRAVIAVRLDLLDPLLAMSQLGKTIARGLCLVEPLRPIDWRESIPRALEAYGYELEDESLEDELSSAIEHSADAMPLVEFALTELWNARDRDNKKLTRAALEAVGGIEGALEKHAETTIASMTQKQPAAMDVIRAVLLALTTPEGTRRAQSEDELVQMAGPAARDVIAALTKARLLVPSKDGVTVAHEALLSRWQRLRSWIAEAREDRILAEEIERDGARWYQDPESIGLWTGRRLGFARDLVRKPDIRLSENAISFVRASQRAHRRKGAAIAIAGLLVLAVMMGAAVMYLNAQHEVVQAQRQRLEVERAFFQRIEEVVRNSKDKDSKLDELSRLLAERKNENIRPIVTSPPIASVSSTITGAPAPKVINAARVINSSPPVIAPPPAAPPAPAPNPVAPEPTSLLPKAPPPEVPKAQPAKPSDLATKPSEEF